MSEANEHKNLDVKIARGLAWSAGAKWATQLITWVSVLVAARLLSPSDFGIMEMAGFLFIITNVLAEFGLGTAIVQMRELSRKQLSQINSMCVLLCTMAFILVAAAAPAVADFFKTPGLKPLIVVNSLAFFLTGFQIVPYALLQRDLDYRRLFLVEALQAVIQAVVLVVAAAAGMGAWALVFSGVGGKAGSAAMMLWWKHMPFAVPRWKEIRTPMQMGMDVAVGTLANSIYTLADGVIIGRLIGSSALGNYRMAINLASAPAEKIGLLLMRVTGPLFARLQHDMPGMRRYFLRISELLATALFPLFAGLAAVSEDVIDVVLGPKWQAAATPLRWLALYMAIRTMHMLAGQVLMALRLARFTMWVSVWSLAVTTGTLILAAPLGLAAVAAAWIVLAPVTTGPLVIRVLRGLHLSLRDFVAVLTPALAGCAIMLAVVTGVQRIHGIAALPPVVRLALEVTAGGIAYTGFMLTFYRERMLSYIRFARQLRSNSSELPASESATDEKTGQVYSSPV